LASRLYEGKVKIDEELVKVAYTDTLCGICDEICAPEFVPLFRALREEIMDKRPDLIPPGVQRTNQNIADHNNPFGLSPGDRTAWAEDLGLKRFAPTIYFAGCYASYRYPEIARSTVMLMRAAGAEVGYLGRREVCCGNQAYWSGNTALALKKARSIMQALKESGASEVVFSCAQCYENFRFEYSRLTGDVPFRIFHITEWLHERLVAGKVSFGKRIAADITYHDPCRLGRYSRIFQQPRRLLLSVDGVSLKERTKNPQWESCCGSGGGIVKAAYPDFAQWAGNRRVTELRERSTNIITACPMCLEQIAESSAGQTVKATDITVFLAQAL
jgi:heterodisulfide reductase subunit D